MSRAAFDYSQIRMDLLREIQASHSEGTSPTNVQFAKAIYVGQATMTKHLKWLIDEGFVKSTGYGPARKLTITEVGKVVLRRSSFEAVPATEPVVEVKQDVPETKTAPGQNSKEDDVLGLFRKLENVETKDLVKELARREGASLIRTRAGQQFKITGDSSRIKEIGKATILLIRGA